MSRDVRLVSYLVNFFRNNKLPVHLATLQSHAIAFMTGLNRYFFPIHLLKMQHSHFCK